MSLDHSILTRSIAGDLPRHDGPAPTGEGETVRRRHARPVAGGVSGGWHVGQAVRCRDVGGAWRAGTVESVRPGALTPKLTVRVGSDLGGGW